MNILKLILFLAFATAPAHAMLSLTTENASVAAALVARQFSASSCSLEGPVLPPQEKIPTSNNQSIKETKNLQELQQWFNAERTKPHAFDEWLDKELLKPNKQAKIKARGLSKLTRHDLLHIHATMRRLDATCSVESLNKYFNDHYDPPIPLIIVQNYLEDIIKDNKARDDYLFKCAQERFKRLDKTLFTEDVTPETNN